MSPSSFSWITTILGPVSSLLISAIFFYGALQSRFRLAFSIIASAGLFFFASYLFWLSFQLQQTLGLSLLSKETFQTLFPLQALSLYVGVVMVIIGDVMLVWQVSTAMPRVTSNQAMQPTPGRSTAKFSVTPTSLPAATRALASGG
jgi:hypothetical protein